MLWLAFKFLSPLGWAQRACLGLIRESLRDKGMTLNMSWHNVSAPSRLSSRSGITQPRRSHLILLFLRESKNEIEICYVCVSVCVLQISCQKFHILLSVSVADVMPQADSLQMKMDSTHRDH